MHVEPFINRRGKLKLRPFYRVGTGMGADGSAPTVGNWTGMKWVRQYSAENIQCASISIGTLRPTENNNSDLVFIHIDRKKNINVLQYWIGLDLQSNGNAQGGWLKGPEVPGWYGRHATAVSAQLIDLDANGMPELVIYHVDNTKTIRSDFVRIGKDLNRTGLPTNGWSDFVAVPVIHPFPTRRSGAFAIHPRLGANPYPVIAAAQRQRQRLYPQKWDLYLGTAVLTPAYLRTSKYRAGLIDLSSGCIECYNETFAYANQCRKDLKRCQLTVDEVALNLENSTTTSDDIEYHNKPFIFQTDNVTSYPYGDEDPEEMSDPSRPNKTENPSIFCEGFHYLYTKRTGCDVVDRETVIAKGLQVAFSNALLEAVQELDPESLDEVDGESLFETPAGSNGSGLSVVAQVWFRTKKKRYRDMVNAALDRIRGRKGFDAILDPASNWKRTVKVMGNRVIVTFVFKEEHLVEGLDN